MMEEWTSESRAKPNDFPKSKTISSSPRDVFTLRWCHDGRDCVSNHQPHNCLLNRLFGRRSKQTSKLRVTDLCEGNSPILHTNGHQLGKCFHLMTSSWFINKADYLGFRWDAFSSVIQYWIILDLIPKCIWQACFLPSVIVLIQGEWYN